MRILFLTNHLKANDGWSRYSLDLAEGLKAEDNEVLCLVEKIDKNVEIKQKKVFEDPLDYLANPFKSFLASLKTKKEIKKFKPDVIHFIAEPYATILPFLNTKKARTVITVHGTYSTIPLLINNKIKKKLARLVSSCYYKKADKIISVSSFTKKHLINHFPDTKNKTEVVTNGINLDNFVLRPESNEDYNINKNNKIKQILFVGEVKNHKGLKEAIEALKIYKENYDNNFLFNIVGFYKENDSYYRDLIKLIGIYNLKDNIVFYGRIKEEKLKELYHKADLFLMLSINTGKKFEGFGLVYLEANAYGVPCIGSVNSGAIDAILNGENGFTVSPEKSFNIAKKIDLVLNKNKIKRKDCFSWAKNNSLKIKINKILKHIYAT